jgi:hypothetical protein
LQNVTYSYLGISTTTYEAMGARQAQTGGVVGVGWEGGFGG